MKFHSLLTNPALDGKPLAGPLPASELVERSQTFAADIFIPLLQNVIGGLAVAGLCAIAAVAVAEIAGVPLPTASVAFWCLLVGGTVTCLVTVVRFFGDDIGLVRLAYRRGQDNMRLRVNALELELQAARSQLAQVLDKTRAIPPTAALQQLERIYTAAKHLIHWHFEALPIDRRSCESRNMAQADWRRARHLLLAAGVLDESGISAKTLPEALARAHVHYQKLVSLGGHDERFVSPV